MLVQNLSKQHMLLLLVSFFLNKKEKTSIKYSEQWIPMVTANLINQKSKQKDDDDHEEIDSGDYDKEKL